MRQRILRQGIASLIAAPVAAAALLMLGAAPAEAFITTPSPGQVVRGDVSLSENRGGVNHDSWACGGANSLIQVFRARDNALVFQQAKGGSGSWTTAWNSHGHELGTYRVLSTAFDTNLHIGFRHFHCHTNAITLSNHFFTLDNLSRITYTGASQVFYQENLSVGANLRDATTGRPIGGRGVNWSLPGLPTASAGTDGNGNASSVITANRLPGTYSLNTFFNQDCCWRGSSTAPSITILKRPTGLNYTGPTNGYWQEDAPVTAVLTDVRNGQRLAGRPVTFSLSQGPAASDDGRSVDEIVPPAVQPLLTGLLSPIFGVEPQPEEPASGGGEGSVEAAAVTATTDGNGIASANLPLDLNPGQYTLNVTFGEDPTHLGSARSVAFEILKRPTVLTYTGPVEGRHSDTYTLSAVLTDERNGSPLPGQPVDFSLGTFSGQGITDADGIATVDVTLLDDPGDYTASVGFSEDAFYLGSADSAAFHIFFEYIFDDAADALDPNSVGRVEINTSNKQFRVTSADGVVDSGIRVDKGMTVIHVPTGAEPPPPPCDPTTDPTQCVPEPPCDPAADPTQCVPEPPPAPCDPTTDPAACLPEPPPAPCDPTTDPTQCVPEPPPVPECVEDPTGGDPVCPGDFVPPPPQPASGPEQACRTNPLGGDDVCVPEGAEICTGPVLTGCHERFVLMTYSEDEITLVGVFDLMAGTFASASRAGDTDPPGPPNPEPPAPPCDPSGDPTQCVPTAPEPTPPCDPTTDPTQCVPSEPPATPEPVIYVMASGGDPCLAAPCPVPPPPPCDPKTDPTQCVPQPPCDPTADPTQCVPAPPEPPPAPCDPTTDPTQCAPEPPGPAAALPSAVRRLGLAA